MKKRLLFAFMAMCVAVSGFALEKDEFVYTPQGRFLITGANVASSNFADWTGWKVTSATEGKTLDDIFTLSEGVATSIDATAGEGMYFKFEPTSAFDTYMVSYKMKGAFATSIRIKTNAISTNLVRVKGNSGADFGADSLDYICFNTAEELSEDWQTFNYAIIGDGTPRTYYISFTGMDTSIGIADLQIAPAAQVADLRQRDAMLEKINTYKNCYAWDAALLEEMSINEAITNLESIGDTNSQAELDEHLTTAEEILDEFLKANMDDYLAGNNDNYLKKWRAKTQKATTYGVWTGTDRLFWENNGTPFDIGHYQMSATWANGNPTKGMGVYTQKDMTTGSYVFAIEAGGMFRENLKNSWDFDDGIKPAYGVAYVAKVVNGEATDTIASQVQDVSNYFIVDDSKGERRYLGLTPFSITAKISEEGTYEFGMLVYCKEAYQSLARGSAAYLYNASIWGKNENKYNQKQLGYETDVREQITTGRTQLTTAKENIANAEYFWGKAELQACVDTVEVKIAGYEQMDQDAIIATYQEDYAKSTSAETGYLVYTIYQEAVKDIIAANKKFVAVNDTLASIQTAIDAAEATMALRIYSAATGKDALQTAISKAKGIQTQMKAAQYSEENAAAIVAANTELEEAVEAFKASVPASAIATIVDIDFEQNAVKDAETGKYSVPGVAGAMEFSNFSTIDEPSDGVFEQGLWNNGEQQWKGYLRVGNGSSIVSFDPTVDGSMGTNILKMSCDFFIQGLSNRFIGFYLKNETDSVVAGFYANYYNNTVDATSNLPIDLNNLKYGSGSNYDNGSPEGAEPATANPLPKNSFEVVLDFGEGSIYCTTTSAKGVATTAKQVFDKSVPRSFVLQCNYDTKFASRRCWFDNLKIERIAAGATEPFVPSGIAGVKAAVKADGAIYNLAGQKVGKDYKGLVIMNGKKFVQK